MLKEIKGLTKKKKRKKFFLPFLAFPPGLALGGAIETTLRRLGVWEIREEDWPLVRNRREKLNFEDNPEEDEVRNGEERWLELAEILEENEGERRWCWW